MRRASSCFGLCLIRWRTGALLRRGGRLVPAGDFAEGFRAGKKRHDLLLHPGDVLEPEAGVEDDEGVALLAVFVDAADGGVLERLGVALDQEANSDMTGRLLIPGFLLIVDTDKNMSGLSEPVLIKTDGSAVRMNKTQLMQLITDGKTEDFDYVLSVSLSPDGEYALVTGRSCMYILRLRTLETRRVEFPEGTECAQFTFDTPINARFARGIDWHEANRICSSAGMFRLTFK